MEERDGDYLAEGWSRFERLSSPGDGDLSVCWAVGLRSEIRFPKYGDSEGRLLVRARTSIPGQIVRVSWNGRDVGSFALGDGEWKIAELFVPPGLSVAGADVLRFDYARTETQDAEVPGRSVLFDWIDFQQRLPLSSAPTERHQRLGSQIHSDGKQVPLPGRLSFRIEGVPVDAKMSFGASTTPIQNPGAAVDLKVSVASASGTTRVLETTFSNLGRRRPVEISRVVTDPPSADAETLSDGRFGDAWTSPTDGPTTIRLELVEPTVLEAFSIGTDATGDRDRGVPARIIASASSDGVTSTEALTIDHANRSLHQWHLLPKSLVRALELTIEKTHDGQPVSIDEIVLSSESDLESLPDQLGRWNDYAVDLSGYAGEHIDVTFDFGHLEGQVDRGGAKGLLSGPRVELARRGRDLNLIVISVDTVRTDRLSSFGYERPTTPFLEKLVERSGTAKFDNARSTSTWTPPSHLAMMAGRTPLQLHVNATRARIAEWYRDRRSLPPLDPSLPTLASILRSRGYATMAFSSAGGTLGELGLQNGFSVYDSPGSPDPTRPLDYFDELVSKSERAGKWLEVNRDRNFFLFLHTYAAHLPYKGVELARCDESADKGLRCRRYRELLHRADNRLRTAGELGKRQELLRRTGVHKVAMMSDLYDSGLLLVDSFLEATIAQIDRLGLRRSTLVVITSDHGEPFGEHFPDQFSGEHGYGFYDEYLRVPLLFLVPGLDTPVESSAPVSLVDIVPTVLDIMGIEAAADFDGHSLVPAIAGAPHDLDARPIFYEVLSNQAPRNRLGIAASRGRFKILANHYNLFDGSHELYDLESDPGEKNNVASEKPAVAEGLLADLDGHLSSAFLGMVVVDVTTLGGSGQSSVKGTIEFDEPVHLFEMGVRRPRDVVRPTRHGGGMGYTFNLGLYSERRLIGFRIDSDEVNVSFGKISQTKCDIFLGAHGERVDGDMVTTGVSEIVVPSLPRQSDRPGESCAIRLYYVSSGEAGRRVPVAESSSEISDEARESAIEHMRALGYVE